LLPELQKLSLLYIIYNTIQYDSGEVIHTYYVWRVGSTYSLCTEGNGEDRDGGLRQPLPVSPTPTHSLEWCTPDDGSREEREKGTEEKEKICIMLQSM
jgi:hypothetical protein